MTQLLSSTLNDKYREFIRPKANSPHAQPAAEREEEWLLIDFKSFYVHIVSPSMRQSLDLEGLWTKEIFESHIQDFKDNENGDVLDEAENEDAAEDVENEDAAEDVENEDAREYVENEIVLELEKTDKLKARPRVDE